jgi:hypothetical protein
MESEVMCEVGSWKSFEELEEVLTLDDLFILYERAATRQNRLIKTIAGAMGASFEEDSSAGAGFSEHPGQDEDIDIDYQQGEITAGQSTLFGYKQSDN